MMEFHPFSSEYPLMPDCELKFMVEGMLAHGFDPRFPIMRYQGKILDGRNRYRAATEAGVKPLFDDFDGDDEEAREFVERANEHRRHLAEVWLAKHRQERIERVATARLGGESIRSIAGREGVGVSQVQRDLEEAKSTVPGGGGTVEPKSGKVKGRDGRTRTAKPRKPRAKKAKKAPEPQAEATSPTLPGGGGKVEPPATEPEPPRDESGFPVPDVAAPAFALAGEFSQACRTLDGIVARVRELAVGPAGRLTNGPSITQAIQAARKTLWHSRPTHVCGYCRGEPQSPPCNACKGEGWTSKAYWKQSPAGRKAAADEAEGEEA